MNPQIEKVLGLPAYQRFLIVFVLAAAIVAGFYFMVYEGQREEQQRLEQQRESAQTVLQRNQRIANNLDAYRTDYNNLLEQLEAALDELPLDKEIPALLTKIAELAQEKGLDILRFRPLAEVPKDFYAEVPVELRLAGSYHNVAMFFDAVSKMERIVNIKGVRLGGATTEDGRTVLSIESNATTFRFLGDRPNN
ncbi:type 4a pilus biogenesis protein PilO [Pelovirga terrestris]|uniref:Type 4a pilus biogenesis protein PilO n=1 Tax=Pelovirga terrestris TaxID=2771352 RepID=A0A8J6UHJ7_9BACT|nr:type 4a pilus biogenesis protein PilO [Pelovirga terrestris]MBD1399420.1 type 4a pilus biogenesis protein PilO [Pelovirga terrestris]